MRVLQRNRSNGIHVERDLLRRRLIPTICGLQAGGSGKLVMYLVSFGAQRPESQGNQGCKFEPKFEGPRTRSQWHKTWSKSEGPRTGNADVQGLEKMGVSAQADSKFILPLPFCSLFKMF